MKRFSGTLVIAILIFGLSSACALRQKKTLEELKEPVAIDCSTAQGDLRLLQHEKANCAERMAEGITAIYPASLVIGVLTRTESTKLKVAVGEYNKAIDQRIAEIKQKCGIP